MKRTIRLKCPSCTKTSNYLKLGSENLFTCAAGHRFKTVGCDNTIENGLFDLEAMTEHEGCPKGKMFHVFGEA